MRSHRPLNITGCSINLGHTPEFDGKTLLVSHHIFKPKSIDEFKCWYRPGSVIPTGAVHSAESYCVYHREKSNPQIDPVSSVSHNNDWPGNTSLFML